jgi:cyclophilin family peptidyl-prolyl cis-trans isomerase
MLHRLFAAALVFGTASASAQAPAPAAQAAAAEKPAATAPRVLLRTSMGDITIELDPVKAPKSTENFLQYVRDKFYDGTVFHRVIGNFMIQGGGMTQQLTPKTTRAPVANEANNGLSNLRGTIAMARTTDPNSATAQFFINVVDNKMLDHVSPENGHTWGYAVFGKVVAGMDVVDQIKAVETGPSGMFDRDVPKTAVVINSAEVLP